MEFYYYFFFGVVISMMTSSQEVQSGRDVLPVQQRSLPKDVLCTKSCRYLKENEYLNKFVGLKKLCLATSLCNDVIGSSTCRMIRKGNGCSHYASLAITYCKYTCNLCSLFSVSRCQARPLGMQNGKIANSQITASSQFSFATAPFRARIHANSLNGVWASKYNKNDWIQVDLGRPTVVTGVATQGRLGYNQWVTSYSLEYSNNGRVFYSYQGGKVLDGNKDRNSVIKHDLRYPFRARYVRLVPRTFHGWVSMRMELYGCK